MHPLRFLGVQMADTASDTFGDGFWNYITTLGFILPLVGVEELIRSHASVGPSLPTWASIVLIIVGLPLYQSKAIWKKLRKAEEPSDPPPLGYLSHEDCELGGAIMMMAWRSAWGKWYAAQGLANSPNGKAEHNEDQTMRTANHLVDQELIDGKLVARGRRPGQMNYEVIPQTYWRSSATHMQRGGPSLWRMILIPTGGAEFNSDGTLVAARDQAAKERTDHLAAYDSIIVQARQFESLWPRQDKKTDTARRALLKKAKKAGAPPAEIAKLQD